MSDYLSLVETCGGTGWLDCFCGGDFCACTLHGGMFCGGCEDCQDLEDGDYNEQEVDAKLIESREICS